MSGVTIAGGFTLDDTVLLDNRVMRRAPGGNLLYGAAGARIWSDEVYLLGTVGCDYPRENLTMLESHGLHTEYLYHSKDPCIKVWALHERNGGRQLVYQLDSGTNCQMDPRPEQISSELLSRTGTVHICAIPPQAQRALADQFAGNGRRITLDVIFIEDQINSQIYRDQKMLEGIDAFLPSAEEAVLLREEKTLPEILKAWMAEESRRIFVIKNGSDGCLAGQGGRMWHIPCCPVQTVDTTGAGDTFCGGFAAGLEQTGDAREAAAMGCVSASFAVEDFGGLQILRADPKEVEKRIAYIYKNIEEL